MSHDETPERFYGWYPRSWLTQGQAHILDEQRERMPDFRLIGDDSARTQPIKVALWDCSLVLRGGRHLPTYYQQTGSCVGNGMGQANRALQYVGKVRLKDREEPHEVFWPLVYGRSRYYAGMSGRGEGSTGAGAAEAMLKDGILEADTEGLPQATERNGSIQYSAKVEMDWSNGAAIPQKWLDLSRPHVCRTVAKIREVDQARQALQNWYPLTIASGWGGQMQPAVQGDPPVLLNRRVTTWWHQMSIHGWWNHPNLGELYYVLNSWGADAHGTPPDGSPPGGFWVRQEELDWIIRSNGGEVYAVSQFEGFKVQTLDLSDFVVIGGRP